MTAERDASWEGSLEDRCARGEVRNEAKGTLSFNAGNCLIWRPLERTTRPPITKKSTQEQQQQQHGGATSGLNVSINRSWRSLFVLFGALSLARAPTLRLE